MQVQAMGHYPDVGAVLVVGLAAAKPTLLGEKKYIRDNQATLKRKRHFCAPYRKSCRQTVGCVHGSSGGGGRILTK